MKRKLLFHLRTWWNHFTPFITHSTQLFAVLNTHIQSHVCMLGLFYKGDVVHSLFMHTTCMCIWTHAHTHTHTHTHTARRAGEKDQLPTACYQSSNDKCFTRPDQNLCIFYHYVILGQDDEFPQIITCAESVLTHWWQLLHSNPTYNLNSNPLTHNTNMHIHMLSFLFICPNKTSG